MIEPELSLEPQNPLTRRTLRQFAGLWLLVCAGVALWQWFVHDREILALVLAGWAGIIGSLGLVRPEAIRPVFVGLMVLTCPIGWLVSHVLLAVLFYGVFTPVGALFRLMGRDALFLQRRLGRDTYWVCKPQASDVRSYLRQS